MTGSPAVLSSLSTAPSLLPPFIHTRFHHYGVHCGANSCYRGSTTTGSPALPSSLSTTPLLVLFFSNPRFNP